MAGADGHGGRVKPYYEHSGITIYHGDCLEWMPAADAVVTDPPYGIAYRGGGGGNLIHSKRHRKQESVRGDDAPFDPAPLMTFDGVALFGAQHYYSCLPAGGTLHVWDKRGDYNPIHTADIDMVWINRKEVGRKFRLVWRGLCREAEQNKRIVHPTQKPIRLMGWVIGLFPNANTILDPYAGSGSTLIAAKMLGRCAIGIEIEERYCEIAAKRLQQEVLPLELGHE
jgi:site-specific DNA-methyltransferase (adenine-specific)